MRRTTEMNPEPRLQLQEVTPTHTSWHPAVQFAAQRQTRPWARAAITGFDWQRAPAWHPRRNMN